MSFRIEKVKEFNSAIYGDNEYANFTSQTRLKSILNYVSPKSVVLEVACGSGYAMLKMAEKGCTVEGIDISDAALKVARSKNLKVYDLDLNEGLPKKFHNKYDFVVAGEIIEHIYDTDAFLQNIRKALKEKGSLILTTPNVASLGRRIMLILGINPILETTLRLGDAGHVRYFTFKTLFKLLEENKFKVTDHCSNVVNFTRSGSIKSVLLAKVFPTLGSTLIVKAEKCKD